MPLVAFIFSALTLAAPMTVEVDRDRITDRVSATATLRAGDDRLEVGCTPYEPRRIWVRLRSRRWFREGDPFVGNVAFRYRFDDRRAHGLAWSVRERSAMLVGRRRVEQFIRELLTARQVVIRAPGPERRHYDLVFDIDGADEAVNRAMEACGDPFLNRLSP